MFVVEIGYLAVGSYTTNTYDRLCLERKTTAGYTALGGSMQMASRA